MIFLVFGLALAPPMQLFDRNKTGRGPLLPRGVMRRGRPQAHPACPVPAATGAGLFTGTIAHENDSIVAHSQETRAVSPKPPPEAIFCGECSACHPQNRRRCEKTEVNPPNPVNPVKKLKPSPIPPPSAHPNIRIPPHKPLQPAASTCCRPAG